MSVSKRRKIAAGVQADAVFMADGGPVIVSGGRALQIAIVTEGQQAAISLKIPESGAPTPAPLAILATGPANEIADTYSALCADIVSDLRGGRRSPWRSFSYGTVVGAVLAATVFGAVSASIVAGAWRASHEANAAAALAAGPATLPSASSLQELMPALEEIQKHTAAAKDVKPPLPAETAPSQRVGIPLPPDVANPAAGLPPYVPLDALAGKDKAPAADESKPAVPEPPVPDPAKPDDSKSASPADATGGTGTAPAADGETGTKAEPAVQGDKVDLNADKPSERTETKAEAVKEPGKEEASPEDKAKLAAKALRDSGMTQSQAVDVLSQLEALGQMDPEKITPQMLSTLPHEVAKMLIDSGLVNQDDAPDGVPYSIIRVPESVVDKHRGEDGIADIPERNSWASTGNYVSIPLPGGGDIKTPEDLKSFHLEP